MTWVSFSIKQQARRVILSHNASKPLFVYLPFQSVHGPLSVDRKYEQKYRGIRNKKRRTYAGMVDILDEAIGNVTEAMKEAGWVVKAKTPTRARCSLYQVVRTREPEWRENVTTKNA